MALYLSFVSLACLEVMMVVCNRSAYVQVTLCEHTGISLPSFQQLCFHISMILHHKILLFRNVLFTSTCFVWPCNRLSGVSITVKKTLSGYQSLWWACHAFPKGNGHDSEPGCTVMFSFLLLAEHLPGPSGGDFTLPKSFGYCTALSL